ncbi:hypothetical protein ACHMW6_09565 [Pseudoduganella sp. UC29_106]|uniref:hypothetical protein n=1 Tax=Pseudoduganella sp. UC29_106 TaxID=3374553 RepID=UPI0037575B9C
MHYQDSTTLPELRARLSELDEEMALNEVALRTAEMAGGRTMALQARKQRIAVTIAELRAREQAVGSA